MDEHSPVFSPDSTKLAFRSERDGGGVYVIPAFGGNASRVADYGRDPQYSPDGKWIAYWIGTIGGNIYAAGGSMVEVVRAEGGVPAKLPTEFVTSAYSSWSPDGRLSFVGRKAPESTKLFVTDFFSEKGSFGQSVAGRLPK